MVEFPASVNVLRVQPGVADYLQRIFKPFQIIQLILGDAGGCQYLPAEFYGGDFFRPIDQVLFGQSKQLFMVSLPVGRDLLLETQNGLHMRRAFLYVTGEFHPLALIYRYAALRQPAPKEHRRPRLHMGGRGPFLDKLHVRVLSG